MRTFILVRGPVREASLKSVEDLVRSIRKKEGIVVISPTDDLHIDNLKEGSVTVIPLQDEDSVVHVIDEAVTRYTVIAVGPEASLNAERAVKNLQNKGSVAWVKGLEVKTFPEGISIAHCHSVVIEYPSPDTEVKTIMFDSQSYYGGLSNRKLSGRKLVI